MTKLFGRMAQRIAATSKSVASAGPKNASASSTPVVEEAPPQQRLPLSPKDIYATEAKRCGVMDEKGPLLDTRQYTTMLLEESDQRRIEVRWEEPRPYVKGALSFNWTQKHVLDSLIYIFSNTYKGTTYLIHGVQALGKNFWQKFPQNGLKSFITSEMWNFCTLTSSCEEFWVSLPPSDLSLANKETLEQFQDLVIYLVAAQTVPQPPTALNLVFKEFNAVRKNEAPADEKIASRFEGVKKAFEALRHSKVPLADEIEPAFSATVVISDGTRAAFKITFANRSPPPACFRLDEVHLELAHRNIKLICPSLKPCEVFHDHLIHRLVMSSTDVNARMIGTYWVHLTLYGRVFEDQQLRAVFVDAIKRDSTLLQRASEEGKQRLPPGDEVLLAYYLNVIHFGLKQGFTPQDFNFIDISSLTVQTPFARLIASKRINTEIFHKILALLGLFGLSTTGTGCRTSEICWKAGVLLYVPFPGDYQKVLEAPLSCTDEFLSYFSECLMIFFPSVEEVSPSTISHPQLIEIYRALRKNLRFFEAAQRLFVLMNPPIEESDFLDLPTWMKDAGVQAPAVLDTLERVYRGHRLFPLFSSMKAAITEAPSAEQASMRVLLTCSEAKLLPIAWTRYKDHQNSSFLCEMVPILNAEALPFALNRVCELCHPERSSLQPSARAALLGPYLKRIYQLGGAVYMAYGTKLVELLDPLLTTNTDPLNDIVAAIKNEKEKTALKELQEASELLASDPAAWWGRLVALEQTLQAGGRYESHSEAFDALFIKGLESPKAEIHKRRGFKAIFDRVAAKLAKQNKDLVLVSLLRHIPVTKGDRIVHPLIRDCLNRCMDRKAPVAECLPIVTALRETGAVEHVDRSFLVRVLSHLTQRFDEITEVPFLISKVNPNPTEIPHLLDFLLSYYTHQYLMSYDAKEVKRAVVSDTLDEMTKHLPLFIARKETRLIDKLSHIVAVLKKIPRDAELWAKFTKLFDLMKKEELFAEGLIQIFEDLSTDEFLGVASINDPPFECFKRALPKKSQNSRLFVAYGAVLCRSTPGKRENEIISAFQSLAVLLDQLKNPQTWQNFARLFLHFYCRPKADLKSPKVIEDAHWIAGQLLAISPSPMMSSFASFLVGVPVAALNPSWKPTLAGLIARESSARSLYGHLIQLANETERPFFERCRDSKQDTSSELQEYQRTQIVPALPASPPPDENTELRRQTEKLLSVEPMTAHNLMLAFNNLKKLPAGEYALWEKFFSCLTAPNIPIGLLRLIWQTWISKHPPQDAIPEQGKYWDAGIRDCFGASPEMGPLFAHFLVTDAPALISRLEGVECRKVVGRCLQMGTAYCWKQTKTPETRELTALHALVTDEKLREKIGDPWAFLNAETECRLALMLAQHPSDMIYLAGHNRILLNITLIDIQEALISDLNRTLLKCFCDNPYMPRSPEGRATLYQWIENSWLFIKSRLSEEQVCVLVTVLSQFNLKKEDSVKTSSDIRRVFSKWEELASGRFSASDESGPILPSHPPFFTSALAVMDGIARETALDAETKLKLFLSLHQRMALEKRPLTESNYSHQIVYRLNWGVHCFSFVPPKSPHLREAVDIALSYLLLCLPYFNDSFPEECKKAAESFIPSLPSLMNLGATDDSLRTKTLKIIDHMMQVPWIRQALPEAKHSWPYLLYCLCESISTCHPDHRKKVASDVLSVFTNSTHIALLLRRSSLLTSSTLIPISLTQFTAHFITMPELEVLGASEWKEFFKGLSDQYIDSLIESLKEDLENTDFEERLKTSLALARVAIYAKKSTKMLDMLVNSNVWMFSFVEAEPMTLQLLTRIKWILAIRQLMSDSQGEELSILRVKKRILTASLGTLFLEKTLTDEDFNNHSSFIIEILSDPETAQTLFSVFMFDESHPQAAKLKTLKFLIEKNIKKD